MKHFQNNYEKMEITNTNINPEINGDWAGFEKQKQVFIQAGREKRHIKYRCYICGKATTLQLPRYNITKRGRYFFICGNTKKCQNPRGI